MMGAKGWSGVLLVGFLVLAAAVGPTLAPQDYTEQDLSRRLEGPSAVHWLGTDGLGRDILSRLLWGARLSLAIGVGATGLAVAVGIAAGAAAGYFGGRVDRALMRATDVFMCIPALFLVLIVVAVFGASVRNTVLVIGLAYWPPTARFVRGEVLALRGQPFVEAARALGAADLRILGGHVLRNALPLVLTQASLFLANAILIESALSFLGLGVPPPLPSWGAMLADGRRFLLQGWWIATFPGLAIFLVVLGFNLLGDGLREALDPRLDAPRRRRDVAA